MNAHLRTRTTALLAAAALAVLGLTGATPATSAAQPDGARGGPAAAVPMTLVAGIDSSTQACRLGG